MINKPSLTRGDESEEPVLPGSSVGSSTSDYWLRKPPTSTCDVWVYYQITKLSSSGFDENMGFSDRICKKEAWTETFKLKWSWPWNLSVIFLLQVTCFANAAMSSLKDSEEQTSLWQFIPGRWELAEKEAGSRGEQVANSHFSNTKASSGNSGWLEEHTHS